MKPVICFDLNGTILDLAALDSHFESLFGHAGVRKEWFDEALKIVFTTTIVRAFTEFSKIAEASLKVVEQRHAKTLSERQRKEILQDRMRQLPPFPDVESGLESLRSSGYLLAVLTNSRLQLAEQALKNPRLDPYFEKLISADSAQRLKPAPEPYRLAAKELAVPIGSMIVIAAHPWDLSGAKWAGSQTCFLQRPDQVLDEITPQPTLVISDLRDLAPQLTKLEFAA